MKEDQRYELYATLKLTTYHYRTIFLLMSEELTQTQIARKLDAKKQNIHSICKELKSMDLICESKRIGNNIYYKINKSPEVQIKGQTSILDFK